MPDLPFAPARVAIIATLIVGQTMLMRSGLTQAAEVAIPAHSAQLASVDQLIVKYKSAASAAERQARIDSLRASGARSGLDLTYLRDGFNGFFVLKINQTHSTHEIEQFASKLVREDPVIEYAEPDLRMAAFFVPNDPRYNEQWSYFETTGGIKLPAAWDLSTGSGATVAVVDSGYRPHVDLVGNILGGYDFISNTATANDGNGRDADAADPGNGCGGSASTWHGTHVAGTVAASTNNSIGVAGVAFNAKVVPARVLGCGGGTTSDIADAIVWASGGMVSGVPANANPAKVLNLSLGNQGVAVAVRPFRTLSLLRCLEKSWLSFPQAMVVSMLQARRQIIAAVLLLLPRRIVAAGALTIPTSARPSQSRHPAVRRLHI
ncbi:MAG TPA: S8 family serine peptidase [Steroidobacteraceae bacterium]|nr:S8 family serine peptidase [Steroidobacteraceae bacterium]HRX90500.1 S8 family serine peptidase [Steroidobacteraceae bacterium]